MRSIVLIQLTLLRHIVHYFLELADNFFRHPCILDHALFSGPMYIRSVVYPFSFMALDDDQLNVVLTDDPSRALLFNFSKPGLLSQDNATLSIQRTGQLNFYLRSVFGSIVLQDITSPTVSR